MDTYPTLLSPIDNFAFPPFQNQPLYNNGSKGGKGKTDTTVPHTPIQRDFQEWNEVLNGPQGSSYPFPQWESPFVESNQMTASPWRPQFFRTISDAYTDSPSSSSSFLSSATGSPWETYPGLAPGSPAMPMFEDFNTQYPGSLQFDSAGETPATAFNTLTLGSPQRSPVMLPFTSEPSGIEPYNIFASSDSSPHFSTNALALDFSADTPQQSSAVQEALLTTPYGNSTLSPHKAKSMPSLSKFPETSASLGVPSFTGGSLDGNFSSEPSLFARATRRKTSRVDYSEQAYDGDSDDEFETGASAGITKRRKGRTVSVAYTVGDSDEDASEDSAGRGRKARGHTRGKSGGVSSASGAAAKRKVKRRHHCTRDGCTSSFTRVTDMERHVASVHRQADTDANRCSFCRKAFSREDAVLRHENDSCPMRPKKKAVERWA